MINVLLLQANKVASFTSGFLIFIPLGFDFNLSLFGHVVKGRVLGAIKES